MCRDERDLLDLSARFDVQGTGLAEVRADAACGIRAYLIQIGFRLETLDDGRHQVFADFIAASRFRPRALMAPMSE